MSEGIWTMTDSEFETELAKAWDEGQAATLADPLGAVFGYNANPYRKAGAGE
jgi:hypothetical protein